MKTLKIKLGLFSLLAVLAASVFLTSCEQNEIPTNVNETINTIQESDKLILPFGINENQDLAIEYLNNATDEQINIWKSNALITEKLAAIGKMDEIEAELTQGENIAEFDFKKVLSEDEMQTLNQDLQDVESRGCVRVYLGPAVCSGGGYPCYCHWALKQCCSPPYGDCYYYWYWDC